MKFAPETQAILDRIEELSKIPIKFSPDLQSPYLLAKVTMARAGSTAHLVQYKPNVPGVNYNLAFQCGFILRLYESPPEERFDFAGLSTGRQDVIRMMQGQGGVLKQMGLSSEKLVGLATQMYDGIMFQVRSMPIGMRIDDWLYRDYPGLRDEQAASIASQQQTNVKSLTPSARAISPPTLYNANVSMSTAYALFADRLYHQNLYTIPFKSAGFTESGQRLLDIFDRIPNDTISDRSLVTAFGDELGLSDWFEWVPFTGTGATDDATA